MMLTCCVAVCRSHLGIETRKNQSHGSIAVDHGCGGVMWSMLLMAAIIYTSVWVVQGQTVSTELK